MNIIEALRALLPYAENEIAALAELAHDDEATEAESETAEAVLAGARRALAAHERWTAADDAAAAAEGWIVSNTGDGFDEIQRLDETGAFHEDAAAIAHVYWMAGTGSELHRRAILHTLRDGNVWAYPQGARP